MSFNSKYTGAQVEAWLDNIKSYSANDILTKLKTVDGVGSGLDADLLNGKSPSELNVGSSDVSGRLLSGAGAPVNANELTYSDWSLRWYSNLPSSSTNLPAASGYQNGILTLPLHSNGSTAQLAMSVAKKLYYRSHQTYDWNEIAYVTDNVASATKLQTAITLWGRSFNGTENISGELFDVKGICTFAQGKGTYGMWKGSAFTSYLANEDLAIYGNKVVIFGDKVGLGVVNPLYRLDLSGDIHCTGTLVQDSDIRLKNITNNITLPLSDIAEAPLFEFTYKSDKDKRIHVGTSAQYWVEKNNWFCKKQDNGYYDMEIQNLALASAISIAKEFKKYKEVTESTISSMKKEIEELKQIILNMNK